MSDRPLDPERLGDDAGRASQDAAPGASAPLPLRESVNRKPGQHTRTSLLTVGATLAIIATMAGFLAPGPPTVAEVARAALHEPERDAPEGSDLLAGFDAVGERDDTVGGRSAETVIYQRGTVGIHYTIVEGKPLELPGSRRERVGELELAVARQDGVNLVAWHKSGKTYILASRTEGLDGLVDRLRRA